jgi:hypothetical protein
MIATINSVVAMGRKIKGADITNSTHERVQWPVLRPPASSLEIVF